MVVVNQHNFNYNLNIIHQIILSLQVSVVVIKDLMDLILLKLYLMYIINLMNYDYDEI